MTLSSSSFFFFEVRKDENLSSAFMHEICMKPSHFGTFSVYVAVNKILKPRQTVSIFRICRRRERNELNF